MRREKEFEKEIARHSPERGKDVYVDNDLLMKPFPLPSPSPPGRPCLPRTPSLSPGGGGGKPSPRAGAGP